MVIFNETCNNIAQYALVSLIFKRTSQFISNRQVNVQF